ncbi:DUF4150 domain-containing protein [Parazoarcus communis]|uniref:Tox-PAAR-like domain-containing protein n=1 Tax=Parazoarcus communis SWub3 = DSM 12120 TaxID=1121029 RepID=A0A323USD5_9RHOO|nr:DUF4150 domain-containing protein [Parazoarcus communis]NMG72725.1 DUF4150 domain-containing protein [Parazoarcus communis SWub3 = DSM 12120]PZA15444.1 hypothetical protein DNK49_17060 [Azoarcus communis] [Parazoarcus communis SWub3 = DSM 12120]
METHVYANDDEFCSRAADGISTAAFPDPCWSPPPKKPGPVLVPYTNTAFARNLQNGTSTVFVCGTPVAKKDVSYLANSTGNEPATWAFKRGDRSHVITGKAYFIDWSPDVKVEGLNVCRHTDPMTHNHG